MSKKINEQELIEKFKIIHRDKYDYSLFKYDKMHSQSTIICPIHGEFEQSPHSHLRGQGCPKCGIEKRSNKRRYDLDVFIKKAKEIHGNKYDYSKVMYNGSQKSVTIICPNHGEFEQTPNSHLQGQGCPYCKSEKFGKMRAFKFDKWVEKSMLVHNNKYDYSKVDLDNRDEKGRVCIICPQHGEFWQTPSSHISGRGCPKCGVLLSHLPKYTTESFIRKANEVHKGKYDYSKTIFNGILNKVIITCPIHGEFEQVAENHLQGLGCKKCGYKSVSKKLLGNKEEFIRKANNVYDNAYDYSKVEYINNKEEIIVICPKHGEFKVRPDNHLSGRSGCPKCSNSHSMWEKEIYGFIVEELEIDATLGDRTLLDGKELDILIPSKMVAIECDGLKWHSEEFKDKNYHIGKTLMCKKNGIRLIHIFEDEWMHKKEIVKSRIKSILGITNYKLYARNCEIREVGNKESLMFLEHNHIQGKLPSKISFGLYHNDELVSLMTFGGKRRNLGSKDNNGSFELLRFCNKVDTNVIGGASKLLKHFIEKYHPRHIISYCDLRWSIGNLYEKLGFTLSHTSKPNYFYIVNGIRKNRFVYRKDVLIKEGFDKNKTEHEIMLERGIYRIYDCGCNVYEMTKKVESN